MLTNPFVDIWHFLTGNTNDYLHQGNWRYVILALFWPCCSLAPRLPSRIGRKIRSNARAGISASG